MLNRNPVITKTRSGRRRRHIFRRRNPISRSHNRNASRTWDNAQREIRSAVQRLERLREGLPEPAQSTGPIKVPVGPPQQGTIIHAPERLSLASEHRDSFLGFLYAYRWAAHVQDRFSQKKEGKTYLIDLAPVRCLDIDAALVLVAEYYRDIRSTNYRPMIDDADWDPGVRHLMQQLGFYDFVDAACRSYTQVDEAAVGGMQFVKFETGKKVISTQATDLIERIGKVAGNTPESESVFAALVEAMMNVYEHAYDRNEPQVFKAIRNWWIAGSYDAVEGILQFVAYDQGVGIPATIRDKPTFVTFLRRLLKGNEDADWIEAAIELGKSSTEMPERGNGLWTICQVAEELEGSSVRILSGCGEVTYSSRGTLQKKAHANPFCGTLVEWTLKMPRPHDRTEVSAI